MRGRVRGRGAVFSLTYLLAGEVQPFHLSQSLTRVLPKQLWPKHAWRGLGESGRENEIVSLFGGLHMEMLQSMEHAAPPTYSNCHKFSIYGFVRACMGPVCGRGRMRVV